MPDQQYESYKDRLANVDRDLSVEIPAKTTLRFSMDSFRQPRVFTEPETAQLPQNIDETHFSLDEDIIMLKQGLNPFTEAAKVNINPWTGTAPARVNQ